MYALFKDGICVSKKYPTRNAVQIVHLYTDVHTIRDGIFYLKEGYSIEEVKG